MYYYVSHLSNPSDKSEFVQCYMLLQTFAILHFMLNEYRSTSWLLMCMLFGGGLLTLTECAIGITWLITMRRQN